MWRNSEAPRGWCDGLKILLLVWFFPTFEPPRRGLCPRFPPHPRRGTLAPSFAAEGLGQPGSLKETLRSCQAHELREPVRFSGSDTLTEASQSIVTTPLVIQFGIGTFIRFLDQSILN